MIDADIYCAVCFLKEAQIFSVSMREIKYQLKKKARAKIDLKNVELQK